MVVQYQVIGFQKEVTGVDNVTQDITCNFTPKAIIVTGANAALNSSTPSAHYGFNYGFSDGTNQVCSWSTSDDADLAADTSVFAREDCVYVSSLETSNDTEQSRATCSFGTNKVTFTWVNASTHAANIIMHVFGGDDITNVKAGVMATQAGTGNKDFTGLGFTPTDGRGVLFTSLPNFSTHNASDTYARFNIGCAVSSSKQWSMSNVCEEGADPTDTWRYHTTSSCMANLGVLGEAIYDAAAFVSWINDGFRLNCTIAAASDYFFYMVINGGCWDIGTYSTNITAGQDLIQATGTGSNQLRGLMMYSVAVVNLDTITTYAINSVGGFDNADCGLMASIDEDAQATTDSYRMSFSSSNDLCDPLNSDGQYLEEVLAGDNFSSCNLYTSYAISTSSRKFSYVTVSDNPPAAATSTMVQNVVFYKDLSGTEGATQDIELNFTPKAIMLFSHGVGGIGGPTSHYELIQGFSDGTNHASVCAASDDADSPSDTARIHRNNAVFTRLSETTNETELTYATCAFGTNKVTFTWTLNDLTASSIHIVAFGGTDITNAKVNTVVLPDQTATTPFNLTGLGFNPTAGNAALFTLNNATTTLANLGTSLAFAGVTFGCAVSTSKRWTVNNVMEDARNPSDTWRYYSDNVCSAVISNTDGTVNQTLDFNGWVTDGFSLKPSLTSSADYVLSYLVIKGGGWDAGNLTSPTTPTNDVDTTVSVNSKPIRGLMMTTAILPLASLGSSQVTATIAIGATDGRTQSSTATVDEDAQVTTDSYRQNSTAVIINPITTDGVTLETATFDSFGTNSFRLDWPTAAAQALYYGWVVVADAVTAQLYPVTIDETSVSVSQTIARIQSLIKTISDTPAVTVGVGAVARTKTLIRPISDPTISVSEALARLRTSPRPISETPSISVSEALSRYQIYPRSISTEPHVLTPIETIVRRLMATRPISDTPTISVSEQLARLQSLIKLISNESPVSIGVGTLTGYKLLTGSVSEPLVKWYYSTVARKIPEGEV